MAIKVLPDAFIHDPQPLARFKVEAKAAAKLNHPNIATIHSVEEVDSVWSKIGRNASRPPGGSTQSC